MGIPASPQGPNPQVVPTARSTRTFPFLLPIVHIIFASLPVLVPRLLAPHLGHIAIQFCCSCLNCKTCWLFLPVA